MHFAVASVIDTLPRQLDSEERSSLEIISGASIRCSPSVTPRNI